MSKYKTVYFVRHGQSVDNAAPVFQAYDSPLSEKGRKQAEQLAERARHISFDSLVASPQKRAKETAQKIAAATDHKIEFSDLFIERFKPTSIDGKPWDDELANKTWREWEKSLVTPGLKIEDGENYDEILARAEKALRYLQERREQSIVVVSHGHFIRTIIARVLLGNAITPETLKNFYKLTSLENTAITVLHFKDAYEEEARWRLWSLNDHAHFAE